MGLPEAKAESRGVCILPSRFGLFSKIKFIIEPLFSFYI